MVQRRMRIGSLFSGYGGLDLAVAQFFNASTAWHCEWDDAPSKILAHHWPDVPNYRDVTQIDWTTMPSVDILTGGYPCQPFSAAGQRKGADDERHLWPYVREAIRHLRPRYTVLENVAGHRSLGFDRVLGDLAEDGLHVWWTSIRASDVGAPHHRERLFILVADPNGSTLGKHTGESPTEEAGSQGSHGSRHLGGERPDQDWWDAADADGGQCDWDERAPRRISLRREATARDRAGLFADTNSSGCGQSSGQPSPSETQESTTVGSVSSLPDWGSYGPAIRRWERVTRPAPAPTELNNNGKPRLNVAFAEWMMGLAAGHVTAVPGISRAHQLKAIGNGVCPQQAYAALSRLSAMSEVAA